MLSLWFPLFQAETCLDWCAKARGRGPTKRIPKTWVTSVPVWQWIASASHPLIQNKRCGKPGKISLWQTFGWRLESVHVGNSMWASCILIFLQIEESLQDLVETTYEQLSSDAPAKALKLIHLFRAANEENYESVWKRFSNRPAYRYKQYK